MPLHIIGNRILTDEEFKEERDGHFKWFLPTVGCIVVIGIIGFLLPAWTEENPWFIFPVMLLAYVRAGLFELIGTVAFFIGFITLAFSMFSG